MSGMLDLALNAVYLEDDESGGDEGETDVKQQQEDQ